jgi:hypothetical protein
MVGLGPTASHSPSEYSTRLSYTLLVGVRCATDPLKWHQVSCTIVHLSLGQRSLSLQAYALAFMEQEGLEPSSPLCKQVCFHLHYVSEVPPCTRSGSGPSHVYVINHDPGHAGHGVGENRTLSSCVQSRRVPITPQPRAPASSPTGKGALI